MRCVSPIFCAPHRPAAAASAPCPPPRAWCGCVGWRGGRSLWRHPRPILPPPPPPPSRGRECALLRVQQVTLTRAPFARLPDRPPTCTTPPAAGSIGCPGRQSAGVCVKGGGASWTRRRGTRPSTWPSWPSRPSAMTVCRGGGAGAGGWGSGGGASRNALAGREWIGPVGEGWRAACAPGCLPLQCCRRTAQT